MLELFKHLVPGCSLPFHPSLAIPFGVMDILFSHSSLRFPVATPRQIACSYQTTIVNKQKGRFDYFSYLRCRQNFPTYKLHHLNSCSGHAIPHESYWRKPVSTQESYINEHEGDTSNYNSGAKDREPENLMSFIKAAWKFTRPLMLIATFIQFSVVLARTWMENLHLLRWFNGSMLINSLAALVSVICANIYASGINQIFDAEIDRINKPDLAIPAGDLSLESAWLLVLSYVGIGISLSGIPNSGFFQGLILLQYFMGSMYSVPPFSLKKSAIGSTLINSMGAGFTFILSLSAGARATLGLPFQISLPVAFLSIFSTMYAFTMSFMKDITDIEGDKAFNVQSLAATLGVRKTVFLGCAFFLLNYIGGILAAIFMPQSFRRIIMIPAHSFFASFLIFRVMKLHKTDYKKEQCESFYLSLWMLFAIEFLIFPFI